MNHRRAKLAALTAAIPLALSGCAGLVGVRDAPAEVTDGPSISQSAGAEVTQRVLGEAAVALDRTGKDAAADHKRVLTGPALASAQARVRVDQVEDGPGSLAPQAEARVLAVSRGTAWPRSILATSRQGEEQLLHVLVADGPKTPYRLFATLPMAAGASIPAFAAPEDGVAVKAPQDVTEEDLSAARAWAQGVSFPAPKKAPGSVVLDDPFSTALRQNAAAQQKALGRLASYKVEHAVRDEGIVFALADGGTLTVTSLTRKDTVTASNRAKELRMPSDLAEVLGTRTISDELTVNHLETVALVTPEKGKTSVVAAAEQLSGAKGS